MHDWRMTTSRGNDRLDAAPTRGELAALLRSVCEVDGSLHMPTQPRHTWSAIYFLAAIFAIFAVQAVWFTRTTASRIPYAQFGASSRVGDFSRFTPQVHQGAMQMRSVHSKSVGSWVGLSAGVSLAIAASANAQNAVQWRVEDGGNGHWYELVNHNQLCWSDARAACEARGGYLVTLNSSAENELHRASVGPTAACYIGAFQDLSAPDFSEPGGGWRWVTGEAFVPIWHPGQPDGFASQNNVASTPNGWHDGFPCGGPLVALYGIEWSTDCTNDGIVDYGQILSGEFEDTNSNGVPDCCDEETSCAPCVGDIDGSGAINGVDLATIMNAWNTDGGKYPAADIDGSGVVDAIDLAFVLSNWGPCP